MNRDDLHLSMQVATIPGAPGETWEVRLHSAAPVIGRVERGPDGYGWTCGHGWRAAYPTMGAALDAMLADPAFGLDTP